MVPFDAERGNVVVRVAEVAVWIRQRGSYAGTGGLAAALLAIALVPTPAAAQLGVFDALARQFSDVSFYANAGGLYPRTDEVRANRITSFGIEILFEIGSITRPIGLPPERGDTVALTWTEMRVVRSAEGVDTINTYEVRRVPAPPQPIRHMWTFELGLGYGQLVGFRARDPAIDLRGTLRDLPALSLYASYVPTGTYFGVRSGLMRFQGLQAFDDHGGSFTGEAESFSVGLVLGEAIEIASIGFFVEGAYVFRQFPSIRWSGGALPLEIPREINLSGWSLGGGIQFAVGRQ